MISQGFRPHPNASALALAMDHMMFVTLNLIFTTIFKTPPKNGAPCRLRVPGAGALCSLWLVRPCRYSYRMQT